MKRALSAFPALGLIATLGLSGCGGSDLPDVAVEGARDAVIDIAGFVATPPLSYRPTALLGVYASIFYANSDYLPVASARKGIEAQMLLHRKPDQESLDGTYALLDELGTVLQIDLPDLLNRSQDRTKALNDYVTGLNNITVRAERRLTETTDYLGTLRTRDRDVRRGLNDANRAARNALDEGDFATASEQQRVASELQAEAATIDAEEREFSGLQDMLERLIEISRSRQDAIARNREVLLAGLQVVDVPGSESIGVLEEVGRNRSRSTDPFGGSL